MDGLGETACQALTQAGYTSVETLTGACGKRSEVEGFLGYVSSQVLNLPSEGWKYHPTVGLLRTLLVKNLKEEEATPGGSEPPKRVEEKEDDDRLKKKRKRTERRGKAKAHFEASFCGSLWGSGKLAPGDDAPDACSQEAGEASE